MARRILWERPLDIFKLVVTVFLATALVVLPLRPGAETLVTAAPAFIRPRSGATFGGEELRALESTAEPGATVRFFDGEKLLGEATADTQGRVELPLPTPLPEGPHNVRAVVVDKNGKEVAVSEAVAFTILPAWVSPVTPAITQPAGGATLEADEVTTLEGTAAPGAKVQIFEGATQLGETTADAEGRWRFELPEALAEGAHTLHFVVVDEAGREIAASEPVAFTIIPAATPVPTPAIVSLPGGASIAAGEPLLLEGIAAPEATIQLYDGETLLGETTADAAGRWRFQVPAPLAAGEHALRTVVLDAEGKEVAVSEPVALTVRPVATPLPTPKPTPVPTPVVAPAITSLPGGASIAAGEPLLLEGTAAPGATMQLYDGERLLGETTADAVGRWRFQVPTPLAAGEHALRTVAVDTEGRKVAISEILTLHVAAAVQAPAISFPKGAAVIPSGPLSGTAEPGARLLIYADNALLGETVAGADGLWAFQLPGDLSAGALTLRVVAVDAAGQVLAESSPTLVEVLELRLPVTGGRQ